MGTAASLKTIAEEAGVAVSTVSRAFTRPELIGEETRAQILAIAERVGYQPNRSARGLVTGRTSMLGLLVPDISNPFFPPLVRAAEDRAYERGYAVLLMDTDEHADRERQLLGDLTGRVDGLVTCSPRSPASHLREVAQRRPMVLVNRSIPGVTSVSCSTRDGLGHLVDHLHGLGHRNIVYLAGPASSWSDRERRSSVRQQAGRRGMQVEVLGPFPATFSGGVQAGDAVVASGATAAVAFDDVVALGAMRRLSELGYDVPGKVSVSGCDDIFFSVMTMPSLTTVATPIAQAGRTAVDLLLDQIEGRSRAQQVSLSGEFVARSSTGPVAQSARRRAARRTSA
ncbi:MAG TPA: LacI family DNA-binding transcriptional regulator [Mycobacteriales bacterium]|jgi:DNA-binding LacI/PurR family transcriptional regulator|nr:LacI family DNA-binding transcriptional regulator [Mycobacteriales bacterium]